MDLSSLIDVCFLLLIYFIVTSTIVPRESDLAMNVPVSGCMDPAGCVEPLWIQIRATGEIHTGKASAMQAMDADGAQRALPLLDQHLALYGSATRAAHALPLVRIAVDDGCSYQRVIDVLNSLAAQRIHAVTFDNGFP